MHKRKHSGANSRSKRLQQGLYFEDLPGPFSEKLFSQYLSFRDLKHCFLVSRSWNLDSKHSLVPVLLREIDTLLLSHRAYSDTRVASLLYILESKDVAASKRVKLDIATALSEKRWPSSLETYYENTPFFSPDVGGYSNDAQVTPSGQWTPWKVFMSRRPQRLWHANTPFQVHIALDNGIPASVMLAGLYDLLDRTEVQKSDIADVFALLLIHRFPLDALGIALKWAKRRTMKLTPNQFIGTALKRVNAAPFSASYLKQASEMGKDVLFLGRAISAWLLEVHRSGAWNNVHQEILELGLELRDSGFKTAVKIAWARLPRSEMLDQHLWLSKEYRIKVTPSSMRGMAWARMARHFWGKGPSTIECDIIRASLNSRDPVLFLDIAIPKINRIGCIEDLFRNPRFFKCRETEPVFKRLGFELVCPEVGQCTIKEIR